MIITDIFFNWTFQTVLFPDIKEKECKYLIDCRPFFAYSISKLKIEKVARDARKKTEKTTKTSSEFFL